MGETEDERRKHESMVNGWHDLDHIWRRDGAWEAHVTR